MSSAIIKSQSRERILPPLPTATIVGDLIPVTVLLLTVNCPELQVLPVLLLGLKVSPGPQKSCISCSLFSRWSNTEPTAFLDISSLPPTHIILILGFVHISQTTKCIRSSVLPCLGGERIICCPPVSIAFIIESIHTLWKSAVSNSSPFSVWKYISLKSWKSFSACKVASDFSQLCVAAACCISSW